MEKLGYLIKSLRECKGLTQKELSNGIMSISQLSKYEREKLIPQIKIFLDY